MFAFFHNMPLAQKHWPIVYIHRDATFYLMWMNMLWTSCVNCSGARFSAAYNSNFIERFVKKTFRVKGEK